MTTKTYQIRTNDLDMDFGCYDGDSPEEALDAMARDVGYASYAEACATGEMSANCRAIEVEPMRTWVERTSDEDRAEERRRYAEEQQARAERGED